MAELTSEQVEIKRISSALNVPFSTRPARPLILSTVRLKRSTNNFSGIPFAHIILMNCLFKNGPWYLAIYLSIMLIRRVSWTDPHDIEIRQFTLELDHRRSESDLMITHDLGPTRQYTFGATGHQLETPTAKAATYPSLNWMADG